jgi:hypothetical protein
MKFVIISLFVAFALVRLVAVLINDNGKKG